MNAPLKCCLFTTYLLFCLVFLTKCKISVSELLLLQPYILMVSLQMTGSNEYKLNQGPEDGISAVKFSPSTAQFLLVSSWDCTVRLFDVVTNTMRMKYQHIGPVLDCAFYVSCRFFIVVVVVVVAGSSKKFEHTDSLSLMLQDPTHSWSGGLDAQLKSHDLNTDQGLLKIIVCLFISVFYAHQMNAAPPLFLTDTIVGTHDAPIRCVEYCSEVNVMVTGSWDRSVRLWDPRTPCNAGTFTQPEKVKQRKTLQNLNWNVCLMLHFKLENNYYLYL